MIFQFDKGSVGSVKPSDKFTPPVPILILFNSLKLTVTFPVIIKFGLQAFFQVTLGRV